MMDECTRRPKQIDARYPVSLSSVAIGARGITRSLEPTDQSGLKTSTAISCSTKRAATDAKFPPSPNQIDTYSFQVIFRWCNMSFAIEKLKKLTESSLPGLKFVVDEPA